MARKSSGNIQKALLICFEHLFREGFLSKTVFPERLHLNEYSTDSKAARKQWKKWQEESRENYKKRVGRYPKWSPENTLQEMVVNLDENCDLKTLEKIATLVEEKLGYRCLATAVHKDEGHYDESGKFHTNHHGHLVFFSVDSNGKQLTRENFRSPQKMRDLQTQIALITGLERGEMGSKRRRLEHREYKIHIKAQKQAMKPLENEIKALKTELKRLQKRAISHENYKDELSKIEYELTANDKKWRDLFAYGCSIGNSDFHKISIDSIKSEIEQLKIKKQEIQDKIKKQELEEATENHKFYSEKIENTTQNQAQNALKSAVWSNFKTAIDEMKKEKMDLNAYNKISGELKSKLESLQNTDILGLDEKELNKFIDKITDINSIKSNVLMKLGDEFSQKKWGDSELESALKSSFWNSIFILGAVAQGVSGLLSKTSAEHKKVKNELLNEIHDLKAEKLDKLDKNDEILKAKVDKLESENSMYKISTLNLLNENSELKAQNKELKATQTPQNSTTTELEIENERLQNRAKLSEIHALKMALKAHVAEIRSELKENHAERPHYAHLEKLNKDCVEKIESLKYKDIDLNLIKDAYDLIPAWIDAKSILNSPTVKAEIEKKRLEQLKNNQNLTGNFGFGR
ncbi:hypothetical protein [Campylobacter geochelonis]|uniref:hypothetical protein n=1 Tax=Campylobacter geochelonis TaxID=1780362 RepID=UPI000770B16C|nr:hypothetical protein [Campylobacter geochelonis]CZE51535.1 mobilization protein [Campylobacter geochelonis]